jgi:hypothetical protein
VALTAKLAFLFFFLASTVLANEQRIVYCCWAGLVLTQTKILGQVWPSIIRKENVGLILAQLIWAKLNSISFRLILT